VYDCCDAPGTLFSGGTGSWLIEVAPPVSYRRLTASRTLPALSKAYCSRCSGRAVETLPSCCGLAVDEVLMPVRKRRVGSNP
jgi:hypothetical protein